MAVFNNILAGASGQTAGGAAAVDYKSLRFNSGDSASLTRTPSSAGNLKTWTWSAWVKKAQATITADNVLFGYYLNSSPYPAHYLRFENANNSALRFEYPGGSANLITSQVFRDPSAWYHIVAVWDTTNATADDRHRLYVNGVQITDFSSRSNPAQNTDGHINNTIEHGIGRYGQTASNYFNGYLADVHFVDGLALGPGFFAETDDITGQWVPKEFVTGGTTVNDGTVWSNYLSSTGALSSETSGFNGDTSVGAYSSDSSPITFTPPSAISFETLRVYTGTGTGTNVVNLDGGSDIVLNNNAWTTISTTGGSFSTLTVDNTAGSAGTRLNAIEVDGVIMIDSTTTTVGYGTNGFKLDFSDNSSTTTTIAADSSGNGNDWTANNISVTAGAGNDSLFDSPSTGTQTDTGLGGEVSGNYATLNPLDSTATLSNGNLDATTGSWGHGAGTIAITQGKWYIEALCVSVTGAGALMGFSKLGNSNIDAFRIIYEEDGKVARDGTGLATVTGLTTYGGGDLIGVSIDMTAGEIKFYKNGTLIHTTTDSVVSSTDWRFHVKGDQAVWSVNFGQRAFAYTAPSGFKALCTTNLTDPTITDPSTVMDVALYTGNQSARSITGLNFSPDLVWIKKRSASGGHPVFDTVRGATKYIQTHSTGAEGTDTDALTAFNSDGFSLGTGYTTVDVNQNTATYVAWTWDGGHPTTPTTGAVAFDGSGDYLSLADSADFDLAGNDWTIEAFVYHNNTNYATFEGIIGQWVDSTGSDRSFVLEAVGAGATSALQFYYYDTSDNFVGPVSGGTLTKNKWHHVAACRSGNTIYMFVDGVLFGSGTAISVNIKNSTNNVTVGGNIAGAGMWNGFISNARIVNGTALYTSNFTPPTSELTNVTNTKLLCCQSATSATTAAVSPGTITANGDAAASSFNPLDRFNVDGTGYATTSAAGITEGTISLTGASVNRSAGFSIVSHTGTGSAATVGHGLGVEPYLIIHKNRDSVNDWVVYHKDVGNSNGLKLNSTSGTFATDMWNYTSPTSTVFTVGPTNANNESTKNIISYCFAPVASYSAMGTYLGNGSDDGPFVYTGFSPRWILIKSVQPMNNWTIYDTARLTYNEAEYVLYPNSNTFENTHGSLGIDIVSNGFKLKFDAAGYSNYSGTDYIYAAFAEHPFKYANAR